MATQYLLDASNPVGESADVQVCCVSKERVRRYRHRIWTDCRRHFDRDHRRSQYPGHPAQRHIHERLDPAQVRSSRNGLTWIIEAASVGGLFRFRITAAMSLIGTKRT